MDAPDKVDVAPAKSIASKPDFSMLGREIMSPAKDASETHTEVNS